MPSDFKFINNQDHYYPLVIELRRALFFDGKEDKSLIHDEFEEDSFHLIALQEDKLIGYGRLTHRGNKAIISQMLVCEEHQKEGIGSKVLKILINESSRENNITQIELKARTSAKGFYHKMGFRAIGEEFPSTKTGIPHQKMILFVSKNKSS